MSQHVDRDPPRQKHPPLIVVLVFDRNEEGKLRPVVEPLEPRSGKSAGTIAAAPNRQSDGGAEKE